MRCYWKTPRCALNWAIGRKRLPALTGALPERPVPVARVGGHQVTDRAGGAAHAGQETVVDEPATVGGGVPGSLSQCWWACCNQRDLGVEYNATLVAANQQPALQIKAFADHLQVEPLSLAAVTSAQDLELWAIKPGGKPISLAWCPQWAKAESN